MVDSVIFWAFALLSVGAALGAILCRSVIYSALCLIVVFFSIAGFFLLNNADFLAISQIIIYAVGLTIIMLFAIMFTGDKPFGAHKISPTMRWANRLVIVYTLGLLGWAGSKVVFPTTSSFSPEKAELLAKEGSTGWLGMVIFNDYAIPFEVASILLLAAMIGAIVIAKKHFGETSDTLGETRWALETASAPSDAVLAALHAEGYGKQPHDHQTSTSSDNDQPTEVK